VAARSVIRRDLPLAAVAAELTDSRHRLNMLTAGDAMTDVRAIFTWSYDTLTGGAARLFRLLGLHPGPDISAAAAASLAGLSAAETRKQLAELTRAHLITEQTPGRYSFHDLLRVYATEMAQAQDSDVERHAAGLVQQGGAAVDHSVTGPALSFTIASATSPWMIATGAVIRAERWTVPIRCLA
jgi:hypothetical protein